MRKKILFKDEEISEEIERHIEYEGLREGERLPSERELAEYYCVQRDTVRNALEILLNKGILIKKPRRGYYIAPARIEFDLNNFRSVKQAIERIGRESKVKLLSFDTISMDAKLSGKTLMPEGTLCYRFSRLRYENNRTMSLERSYLIAENVPGFSIEDVDLKSLSSVLKHKYGIKLASSHQRLTQVYATNIEAELLRVRTDEPLMRYEGLVYDRKGRLIEFFDNVLLIGSIEFRIRDYV